MNVCFPVGNVGGLLLDDRVQGAGVQHHAVVEVRRVNRDVDLEELLKQSAAQREVERGPLVVLANLSGKVGRVNSVGRPADYDERLPPLEGSLAHLLAVVNFWLRWRECWNDHEIKDMARRSW